MQRTTKAPKKQTSLLTPLPRRTPRISYERFYAIKFTLGLGQKKPAELRAFFGISPATYDRIRRASDYADYKRIIGNDHINGADKLVPADAPAKTRKRKTTQTTGAELANQTAIDGTLEKAQKVLARAESILKIANTPLPEAPKKRVWFGGAR